MHPAVQNVACVPMPDAASGRKDVRLRHPQAGRDAAACDELVAFLLRARRSPSFKLPERLEVLPDFPVSTFGKVSKKALAEQIAAQLLAKKPRQPGPDTPAEKTPPAAPSRLRPP